MRLQSIVESVCYLISVIMPIGMTAWRSVQKERFVLRCVLFIAALAVFSELMTIAVDLLVDKVPSQYSIWFYTIKYIIIFILSVVGVKICFDCNWWGALFCANAGYCVQHIAARVGSVIEEFLLKESYHVYKLHWSLVVLISMVIQFAAFAIYYFVYIKNMKKNTVLNITNKSQILIVTFVIGVMICYNSFGIMYATGSIIQAEQSGADAGMGYGSLMFVFIMSILIAFLALALNCGMRNNKKLSDEMSELKRMLDEGKQQYELEKRNIELINIKCHDLKHQLGAMKGKIYEEQIDELKDVIEIFDSSIKTGNEALDVVLTQKNLYCGQHGIRLTCLLDGEHYSFIPHHEVYALFTNIIDNAIEAVEKLPEEKRIISITERGANGFLTVRAENYFSGEIEFSEGLPVSAKDKNEHGFGIKSIKLIAEKYGGGVVVNTEGDSFVLDVYFLENSQKS